MNTTKARRTSVIVALLLLSATLAQAQGAQLLVTNVLAQQRPGTTLVDVEYDLETAGGLPVWVSLHLSTNSGTSYPILCRAVAGSVGGGVLPGTACRIVWNAGVDFPGDFSNPACRLRVTAYDGENVEYFVYVSPGNFMMGSPTTELLRWYDETQHQVTLTHGFSMQTTEVTNQEYVELLQWAYDQGYVTATSDWLYDNMDGSTQFLLRLLDGECEISFSGGTFTVDAGKKNYPVLYMTWCGAAAYCDWLSLQQGLPRAYNHGTWQCNRGSPYTATGYRLPTEAEWEYTCRAETQTPFNTGSCLGAGAEANYLGSSPYVGCPAGSYVGGTMPVGSYSENAFGLYDMHGNLWEWCNDWMGEYGGTVSDPVGPGTGSSRVVRGGGWSDGEEYCRSARRRSDWPFNSYNNHGFRPARSSNSAMPQIGTITIDPEPNSLSAPWHITGPNAFSQSGTGDMTLPDVAAGSYTLTWGAVSGWTTPIPAAETQMLSSGGVVTFAGLYIEDAVVPIGFVSIPPGTFMMGSPTTEPLRNTNEAAHQVTLTHSLHVHTTEVTNQQYRDMAQWAYDNGYVTATTSGLYDSLDGSTQLLMNFAQLRITFSAGVFSCIFPTLPINYVTFYGSVAYCDWLSLQQGLPRAYNHSTWQCNAGNPYTAAGYRLPTEAEWEYACRAGTQTPFNTGSCLDSGTEACYSGDYPYTGCPAGRFYSGAEFVGSYPANAFGLYDMHGNLDEWCNDWWDGHSADGGPVTDPVGAGAGSYRVIRGGYWNSQARYCRSANRSLNVMGGGYKDNGFRPVRSAN